MLRPVIMIGCGGSGQKAVRYVRDSVRRHLEHKGWEGGFPEAWQLLGSATWYALPLLSWLAPPSCAAINLKISDAIVVKELRANVTSAPPYTAILDIAIT